MEITKNDTQEEYDFDRGIPRVLRSDRGLRLFMRMKDPLGFIIAAICAPATLTLGAVESAVAARQCPPQWPPILIVGSPRSGTTLLYQSMVNALNVCFIDNLTNFCAAYPALATLVTKPLTRFAPPSAYASRFGISGGWHGPNTAPRLWKRWFSDGHDYISEVFPTESHRRRMTGTISLIERIQQMPFLNKWTSNSARIPELGNSLPNAVFVRVKRDYLEIAESMLDARFRFRGDPYKPITVWPREFIQRNDQHYSRAICEHIKNIEAAIEKGKRILGNERFFEIDYREFCNSPRRVLASFREYYAGRCGYCIPWRLQIPGRFEYRCARKVDKADYEALRDCLLELGMTIDEVDVHS